LKTVVRHGAPDLLKTGVLQICPLALWERGRVDKSFLAQKALTLTLSRWERGLESAICKTPVKTEN
jgi:hypothetical protein